MCDIEKNYANTIDGCFSCDYAYYYPKSTIFGCQCPIGTVWN